MLSSDSDLSLCQPGAWAELLTVSYFPRLIWRWACASANAIVTSERLGHAQVQREVEVLEDNDNDAHDRAAEVVRIKCGEGSTFEACGGQSNTFETSSSAIVEAKTIF